jgi:hypothetical protein
VNRFKTTIHYISGSLGKREKLMDGFKMIFSNSGIPDFKVLLGFEIMA